VISTKPNITPSGNIENDTGDNIDELSSFSLGLTMGDNDDNTDFDHDAEEDKLYVREDHFEGILVEKTSKKKLKVNLIKHKLFE